MIEIPRSLARTFRAVLRRSLPSRSLRAAQQTVLIEADRKELRLRAHLGEVAVEYRLSGSYTPETLAIPLTALEDFEGRTDDKVVLEAAGTDTVRASWHEGVVPRLHDYEAKQVGKPPKFPGAPEQFAQLPVDFLRVLDDARQSTAREGVRYALTRLQLRGAKGEVIGTDGRELLIQTGLSLPWTEDVLIPAVPIFGCRELAEAKTIAVGKTATHVCLQTDHWTVFLAIDAEGRYPRAEEVIPRTNGSVTTCRLNPSDADFLAQTLAHLPGQEDTDAPVTVDLNGEVVVRARGEDEGQMTEVGLTQAVVEGPAVRLRTNRGPLARALRLGFTQFQLIKADVPIVCRDEKRTYVWMPLGKEKALAPSPDAVRLASPAASSTSSPPKERREPGMNGTNQNGNGHSPAAATRKRLLPESDEAPAAKGSGFSGLIEEAQVLRSLLRDALVRVNQLLIAAKQQRKQGQLLRTTLATLKQLQNVQA